MCASLPVVRHLRSHPIPILHRIPYLTPYPPYQIPYYLPHCPPHITSQVATLELLRIELIRKVHTAHTAKVSRLRFKDLVNSFETPGGSGGVAAELADGLSQQDRDAEVGLRLQVQKIKEKQRLNAYCGDSATRALPSAMALPAPGAFSAVPSSPRQSGFLPVAATLPAPGSFPGPAPSKEMLAP